LFALLAIEELGDMTGVCASVLKQRSMTRVRVDDELRIWQMRAESERIDGGNHDVIIPVGNKCRPRELLQISVRLASGLFHYFDVHGFPFAICSTPMRSAVLYVSSSVVALDITIPRFLTGSAAIKESL
jgi:hypothetical protein